MQSRSKNSSNQLTVWKLQYLSVTQILREINFGEYISSKTAVFAILGALNFANLVNFTLQKVQSPKKEKEKKNQTQKCVCKHLNMKQFEKKKDY